MPRNPFTVLELPLDATADAIKTAWRRLARQHHPDVTSGDPVVEKHANHTMAEINTAYHELRDPDKRRLHREVAARAARADGTSRGGGTGGVGQEAEGAAGPYSGGWGPGRPESVRRTNVRPVTARIDTSALLRPRNSTLEQLDRSPLPGLPPRPRSAGDHEPRRASTPTGPTFRRRGPNMEADLPTLAEALNSSLNFGKFAGLTLGEVVEIEPTYIDWIVRTIDRDPEISIAARVIMRHLTAGRVRRPRLDTFVPRS
ncbi:MAG TPA: J domain-containing protein [Candidatus Limnocylindrales bacterium]